MIIPQKLKPNDEIRIVAPARSLDIISNQVVDIATSRLERMGFNITFGRHVMEHNEFNSSSIESRVLDLHEAFSDKNVKGIITVIGGFNSNQLLSNLDYKLIRENPKILCGYSDITSLQNAIYAKSGLTTYYGPHFSTFGMGKGFEYIEKSFKRCLMEEGSYKINDSKEWSEDQWYSDQGNRVFNKNKGSWTIHPGFAQGEIIGGNLGTFVLLGGTEYMPPLENKILFLEDNFRGENFPMDFDRYLQSLVYQKGFKDLRAIVLGRFESKSNMSKQKLFNIVGSKKEVYSLPIVAGMDFGHTTPMFTFPIGGTAELIAREKVSLTILNH